MKAIVFYDDLCGVCNYWVNWILKNDKTNYFYFAALHSDFEAAFSTHFNYKLPPETIVVWTKESAFLTKSDALIYIFNTIQPNALQAKLLKMFPKPLRDIGYTIFAFFRRYFRMKSCAIPSAEDKRRFLSNSLLQDFLDMQKID